MLDVRIALACAVAAGVSTSALDMLTRSADSLGLIDLPNSRKLHLGSIPLVGGLSIFLGVLISALWLGGFSHFIHALLATSAILALLGALDDRYNLSVHVRLLAQALVVLIMISCTGVYIHSLGYLFGRELSLNWMGIPLTVIAVIGLLNAFNMIDGIDGLVGGLSLVAISSILLYSNADRVYGLTTLMLLLGSALIPYLTANLGLFGHKVFLGDAGSMVLGYLFAWILIDFSQSMPTHLPPSDALWCVALPLLDTLAVVYRRLRQGKSPFKPDRGHIHHIIMDTGLGSHRTLAYLIVLAVALALFGSVIRGFGLGVNLLAFFVLAMTYTLVVTRLWKFQEAQKDQAASVYSADEPAAASSIMIPLNMEGES